MRKAASVTTACADAAEIRVELALHFPHSRVIDSSEVALRGRPGV